MTPVGPGHQHYVRRAMRSVATARKWPSHPWDHVDHFLIDDTAGAMGRGRARNAGIDKAAEARDDWLFFLDADDQMMPNALALNDFDAPATFGAILLDGKPLKENAWPLTFAEIAEGGAHGTLVMGFFCRADLGMRFDEALDAGEDFEFYLRLPGFTKRREPLVDIGYRTPSATGPRGYERIDWIAVCNEQIKRAIEREPGKFRSR